MKHAKNLLALLLAAMMIASLASCGGKETTTGGSTGGNASTGGSASTGETTGGDAPADDAPEAGTPGELTLPLTDKGETLSFFIPLSASSTLVKETYNDLPAFQELEKRTGVHIDWQMTSEADVATNFNLMIASGNLPDLVYGADAHFADGLDASIDDGYFLDLTDLLPVYAPNYWEVIHSDPDVAIDTKTDSGRYAATYQVFKTRQGPWVGLAYRQDWADKLGLDTPVTYADWEEYLTLCRDEMGATAPLSVSANGMDTPVACMSAGYGVLGDFQLTADGSVNYGPYMEGWREYVTMMNDWYEKGLLDVDSLSGNLFVADMTQVITGKNAAWTNIYTMSTLFEASSEDPDMCVVPVTSPVKNEGDELHLRFFDLYLGHTTSISTSCKNPELALRWIDYAFTKEGSDLYNYGVEGEAFNYDENGKPIFTDLVMNNPEMPFAQALGNYTFPPSLFSVLYDWERELQVVPPEDVASFDVWGKADDDWTMPTGLSLTQEEAVERAALMSDISTYVAESTAHFITGVKDIETGWDAYVADLEKLNIARAIEITQAAYDRYKVR